jgi:hypothetical protein
MKNLFVYGDSYSANGLDHITKSWTTLLAESLDVNLENRAVSGGSTHYQFLKLIEDYTADLFKQDDIIVFQTGYPERYHFMHQRVEPYTAGLHSQEPWVKKNKKYINWIIDNLDYDYCHYNMGMITHTLRNIAELNPNLTIILLQTIKPKFIFPFTTPDNFLVADFQLHDISENEFNGFRFDEWHGKVKIDLRTNHLTKKNCTVLANVVEEIYRTRKVEKNLETKFHSKIFDRPFRTKDDINQAIEQQLIDEPTNVDIDKFFKFF